MSSLQFITLQAPLQCRGILYTAHDASRETDRALDIVKAEWALNQGACFIRINVDIPTSISGASAPPAVLKAWRQRTSNNPIVLVDRYKGGLLLCAMIQHGLIVSPPSGNGSAGSSSGDTPWIFYADGDVGMTNMQRSLNDLVKDALRASHRPTLEERTLEEGVMELSNVTVSGGVKSLSALPARVQGLARKLMSEYKFVGNMPDAPSKRHLHMLFPHGDCLLPRSYVQTGTILFKPSRLTGYVLEVLANSPYHMIDTGPFAMGDQAIMDWLLTNSFGVRWPTHTNVHCRNSNFTRSCSELSELTYITRVNKPGSNAQRNQYIEGGADMRVDSADSLMPLVSQDEQDFSDSSSIAHTDTSPWDAEDPYSSLFDVEFGQEETEAPVSEQGLVDSLELEQQGAWGLPRGVEAPMANGAQLLERYWQMWQPEQNAYVAFTCSRWSNSPICNVRRRRGEASPFHYRCGDLLFHLYGCKKTELYSEGLYKLLALDPTCQNLIPQSLRQIILEHRE